jgi:hypothetical protein
MKPEGMRRQLRRIRDEVGTGSKMECANNCGNKIDTEEFIDEFTEALHRNNVEIAEDTLKDSTKSGLSITSGQLVGAILGFLKTLSTASEITNVDPQQVNTDTRFPYYITNDDRVYCPDCA